MKILKNSVAVLLIGIASISQSFSMDCFSCCGSGSHAMSPKNSQQTLSRNQSPISDMLIQNKETTHLKENGQLISTQSSQEEAYIIEHKENAALKKQSTLEEKAIENAESKKVSQENILKALEERQNLILNREDLRDVEFGITKKGNLVFYNML